MVFNKVNDASSSGTQKRKSGKKISKKSNKRSKKYGLMKKFGYRLKQNVEKSGQNFNYSTHISDKEVRLPDRIGTTDSSFRDSLTYQSYPWKTQLPLFIPYDHQRAQLAISKYQYFSQLRHGSKKRVMKSLKEIASAQLAINVEYLDKNYLGIGDWSIWQEVWNQILLRCKDSPVVFKLFALKFGKEKGFRCHDFREDVIDVGFDDCDNLFKIRNKILLKECIPFSNNHRIETFFGNVYINDLSSFLYSMRDQANVFLNLSNCDYNNHMKESLWHIFNIENLVALDLSNCFRVDDGFLHSLCMAIRDGKLPKLTTLRLLNCQKFKKETIENLLGLQKGNLTFVELDIDVNEFHSIGGNKWEKMDLLVINKFPIVLKTFALLSKFSSCFTSDFKLELRERIVFDLFLSKRQFLLETDNHNRIRNMIDSWELRNISSGSVGVSYIKTGTDTSVLLESESIKNGIALNTMRRTQIKKKIPLKSVSVNNFFGL